MATAKTMKKMLKKLIRTEKGQALPLVLILIAVGGLIVAPLLSYMSSGLKVSKQAYERIAKEYYAADAGIEDGLWHINFNHLDDLFENYQRYDYGTAYEYPESHPIAVDSEEINDVEVDVTIRNVWIPMIDPAPEYWDAEDLIGAGKLIIAGSVPAELTQEVKIYYYKDDADPPLYVDEIGIWIPPGFTYNTSGECTLETWLNANGKTYSRNFTPHNGGQAVVWTLIDPVLFTELPEVDVTETPMQYIFTFQFNSSQPERSPEAVSWITTSGVDDIPYTWDADIRVFHIESVAGGENGTTIDAYAIKSDLRQLVSGRNGDYRAIGNTLMVDDDPWNSPPIRETLLDESDAIANDIPDNATVEAAFLYWSAWVISDPELIHFEDDCDNMDQWIPGGAWSVWFGQIRGHYYGGGEQAKYLTMHDNYAVDLSTYQSGTVTISWNQSAWGASLNGSDCLKFQFYNETDGWSEEFFEAFCGPNPNYSFSYVIPDEYLTENFLMRFYLDGFSNWHEYVYLDNIKISSEVDPEETIADTIALFKINGQPVYFTDDEYGNPTVPTTGGYEEITADESTYLPNGPNDYSYSCKKDVSGLVQAFSDHGNATYSVGNVYGTTGTQWSYAGWSLIIIYSSPETKRHQLYLYDDFLYIAPNTDGVEFPISGFLVPDPIPGEVNAAKITCFVGDGDDYYSGDFIAINAPEGAQGPDIPNSYKLWDGVTLEASLFWPLPRMDNTEYSPNNVWNGRSEASGGSFIDGVDIDTFYVPWGDPPSEGLLKPQDSSATIVLNFADPNPIYAELINFIYIVISFRSKTVTGGTVAYLVEG